MKYFPFLFLLLISCTENQQVKTFIDADPQSISERTFENIIAVDSINLTTQINMENEGNALNVSDDNIIFNESMTNNIWILGKDTLEKFYKITFNEGRGPGEFSRMRDVIVYYNDIFITDESQRKIVQTNIEGQLIEENIIELDLDRIAFFNDNQIVVQSLYGSEYVYNLQKINSEVTRGFEKRNNKLHILMYGGLIKTYNGLMFFGGFSEPIIKKYDIETGDLLFSRNVINHYESKYNYATNEAGEFMTMAFTPAAMYAISGLDVIDDYIYVTNHHNGDYNNKFIDVYSKDNGDYIISHQIVRHPISNGLAVDENFIYSIEMKKGGGEFWLMKYQRYKSG